mmetsp:Transcript_39979/g.92064  ORF Transcript_39979/g.92064 Transcript_39979/m.92064 type:complete len:107 (+) Transcript_39979:683-1003(+)
MLDMLYGAGFTDIKITVKENAADIIKDWMPGSGAENYVTSASVVAVKPLDKPGCKDDVRASASCCAIATDCCVPDPKPAPAPAPAPVAAPEEPPACKPKVAAVTGC